MPLRSPVWFLGECLRHERRGGATTRLGARILNLGLLGQDNTRGHVNQACGGAQRLYARNPQIEIAVAATTIWPVRIPIRLEQEIAAFVDGQTGSFGRERDHYDWDTLRGILTPRYGGHRSRGGGGDNEFELVLRMMALLRR